MSPWRPNCYITPTGLVLCPLHVMRVLSREEGIAVYHATQAIRRMMSCTGA